jgi:hypothetical protein
MDNDRQPVARKQQAANSKQQTANSKQQTANSKQQTACYEKVRVGCHPWAAMIVSGQLSLNKQAIADKRKTMLETACVIGINP